LTAEPDTRRSGRSLLALGADPGIHDKHPDSTPLGWARYFEREQPVQLLEPITSSTFSSPGPCRIGAQASLREGEPARRRACAIPPNACAEHTFMN